MYDDHSYALNWWPHQIYRPEYDELFDHEHYSLGRHDTFHKKYVDGELKWKRAFEQKLQDLLGQNKNEPI